MCLLDASKALLHIHSLRLLHCDLKDGNIGVSQGGRGQKSEFCFKLLDFGTCRELDGPEEEFEGGLGTLRFNAPELKRAKNKLIGPFTDSYALGMTIYNMCAMDRPTVEKESVYQNGVSAVDFCSNKRYSSELRNWIWLLLQPDYKRRPTPADTLE